MPAGLDVLRIGVILLFVQIAASIADRCNYDKLRVKIDHLELKVLEMKIDLNRNQQRLEQVLGQILDKLTNGDEDREDSTTITALNDPVSNEALPYTNCSHQDPRMVSEALGQSFKTCLEVHEQGFPSGSYLLQLPGGNETELMVAYCDQDTSDGGWQVVQNRVDGALSFEKNWSFYKKGFGEGDRNYWIGLEILHRLTANRTYELRVELTNDAGVGKYAAYGEFQVGSALEHYKLKRLGPYSGTAEDALSHHVGAYFSTYDVDHDADPYVSCAGSTKGGWWLKTCQGRHYCNLNGIYGGPNQQSIVWFEYAGRQRYTGWKSSRMLIRAKGLS